MNAPLLSVAAFTLATLAQTQPLSYTVDSTSFNALELDGGMVQVKFADLDQDGHKDIVSVGDHGSPGINTNQHGITVFFGNGTGTGWTLFQNGEFGYGGIAAGDINNDGLMDVAYGTHHNYSSDDFGDQLIEAVLGDGTGMNWTPWDDSLATAGEDYGMFGTDLGDVDADGWLDILSGSFGCCAGTHVYLNRATGSWQHSFGYIGGNYGKYVQFGDLDHDSDLDFACCHQNGAPYFGDGTGDFTLAHNNLPAPGQGGFYDVSLGDVDNDGDDELAFLSNYLPCVYRWNEATQQWVNLSAGLPASGTWTVNRLGDVNGDGFLDLVIVGDEVLRIYQGNGGTSWTQVYTLALPNLTSCRDLAIGDVDNSGRPEILVWATYTTGWFTAVNKLKMLRENTEPTGLSIDLLQPKGGECFPAGAARFIQWVSAVPDAHPSSVRIELSTNGIVGPWSVVADGVPDNGTYQWAVPDGVVSIDCRIRAIVLDITTQETDTAFVSSGIQIGICDQTVAVKDVDPGAVLRIVVDGGAVQLFCNEGIGPLTLIDAQGRIIGSADGRGSDRHVLRVDHLVAGAYQIEVRTVAGTRVVGRLMLPGR